MQPVHSQRFVLVLLSALLLLSCSSSGGIGGSGFVNQGTVSEFGSIVVNGTEIDTRSATIIVEGEIVGIGDDAVLDNLDIGMLVAVEGTVRYGSNNFIANRVSYSKNVLGPVESINPIDLKTKEIVALGQTVVLNTVTEFKATTFNDIAVSDMLEVSGLRDDDGVIWATFIEDTGDFRPPPPEMVEVEGYVANLDTVLQTFEINALTIDYSSADTSELPGGVPAEGLFVEVEGTLEVLGGPLQATEIEPGHVLGIDEANEVEVIGFVTDFVSAFEFTVEQQAVETDENTEYVDGSADDIAPGQKLEAEGSLRDGILFAWEIEFWEPDQIEVEGVVNDFVSQFEFKVGTQLVKTDENTVFEGIEPGDIANGIMLEVKGVPEDIQRTVLWADKVSFESE